MDYVPSHGNTMRLDDRDDTSGARVFDGEDQGRQLFLFYYFALNLYVRQGISHLTPLILCYL